MYSKNQQRLRRGQSGRTVSRGSERARLVVFRSLRGVYAQVIDDATGSILASAQWKEVLNASKGNDVKRAFALGKILAKKCTDKDIAEVVFDRGGYKYHGKVKAVADGAREGGLQF